MQVGSGESLLLVCGMTFVDQRQTPSLQIRGFGLCNNMEEEKQKLERNNEGVAVGLIHGYFLNVAYLRVYL